MFFDWKEFSESFEICWSFKSVWGCFCWENKFYSESFRLKSSFLMNFPDFYQSQESLRLFSMKHSNIWKLQRKTRWKQAHVIKNVYARMSDLFWCFNQIFYLLSFLVSLDFAHRKHNKKKKNVWVKTFERLQSIQTLD